MWAGVRYVVEEDEAPREHRLTTLCAAQLGGGLQKHTNWVSGLLLAGLGSPRQRVAFRINVSLRGSKLRHISL